MTTLPIHICNHTQPIEITLNSVSSPEEFLCGDWSGVPYVLINLHLDWQGNLQNDYGLELARDLRTKFKFKGFIVFYSPFPISYFSKKSHSHYLYNLLGGRGSFFFRLPLKLEEIKETISSAHPLTATTLHDISAMLCDLKGVVVDDLRHSLKTKSNVEAVFDRVGEYLSPKQKIDIRIEEFKYKLANASDNKFNNLKKEFLSLCENILTVEGLSFSQKKMNKYTILLLEDDPEILKSIERNLNDEFHCLTTLSGIEALEIIDSDLDNTVKAVIADWRLYEVNACLKKWQAVQGYEVLEKASKNGFRGLFALTSQAEYIVHQIRNVMGVDFRLFKKTDLNSKGSWSIFKDEIQERCDFVQEQILSLPSAKEWSNIQSNGLSYKEMYYQQLNAPDREIWFKELDNKSDEIMKYIAESYNKDKTFKSIRGIPDKFDLVISDTEPDLFPILVQRRIWFGVSKIHPLREELSNFDLFDDIHRIIYRSGRFDFEKSKKSQDNNKIGLAQRDLFNEKMLPEEKKWLANIPNNFI